MNCIPESFIRLCNCWQNKRDYNNAQSIYEIEKVIEIVDGVNSLTGSQCFIFYAYTEVNLSILTNKIITP